MIVRRASAAALALLLLATVAQDATATNDLNFRVGAGTVSVGGNGLAALTSAAVTWNDNWNVEGTDASTTICFNCGQQELNIYDGNYGDIGWAGYFACNDWDSGTVCGWGEVNLNLFAYNETTEARSLMCEEVGHALGLAHDFAATNSCMMRPVCWACTRLSSHDISVANGNY